MKVVAVDGLDREGPGHDDRVVAENLARHWADKIAAALNDCCDDGGETFYRVVPDDYKLKVFEP